MVLLGMGMAFLEYLNLAEAHGLKPLKVEGFIVLGLILFPGVLPGLALWIDSMPFCWDFLF